MKPRAAPSRPSRAPRRDEDVVTVFAPKPYISQPEIFFEFCSNQGDSHGADPAVDYNTILPSGSETFSTENLEYSMGRMIMHQWKRKREPRGNRQIGIRRVR